MIGTSRATGRPRSVISIDSPPATSSRYLLAYCRNSRTPIVFMCYTVAHSGPSHSGGSRPSVDVMTSEPADPFALAHHLAKMHQAFVELSDHVSEAARSAMEEEFRAASGETVAALLWMLPGLPACDQSEAIRIMADLTTNRS